MCETTKQPYLDKECDINFFYVADGLVEIGLRGATFLCEKVILTQEMSNINDMLLTAVGHLKTIIMQVNTMMKS